MTLFTGKRRIRMGGRRTDTVYCKNPGELKFAYKVDKFPASHSTFEGSSEHTVPTATISARSYEKYRTMLYVHDKATTYTQ